MAEIVLGLGTSHGPQVHIPADEWVVLQEKDQNDRRLDYAGLQKIAPPGLEREIVPEVWRRRYAHCMEALDRLSEMLDSVRPDVVVVIGDDQHEQFLDDNMPMFSVYWGEEMLVKKRPPRSPEMFGHSHWHEIEQRAFPDEPQTFPGDPSFARHLIDHLKRQDVDVAVSNQIKEDVGLGHAFAFLYRRLLRDKKSIPMVPVMINTFFPPNQPTPRRCYQVGRLLADAIRAWPQPQRVAVMASGGLSHVIMNEPLDRRVLAALENKDVSTLENLPEEQLTLGTSEIRCWITAAGALEALPMTLLAYEPCYRSLAGTGCGMAFAYWQ